MTVKELREALTQYPDDAIVWLTEDFYGYAEREVDTVTMGKYQDWSIRNKFNQPTIREVLVIK